MAARPGPVEKALMNAPRLRIDLPLLVGVSGGRDSVALLHALAEAGLERLVVCHLDHMLRPDSDEDAWFVSELAGKYGYPFEADRVNVKNIAEERGLSIEAAGREVRYEFFTQVARTHWIPRVLLAHHADDQVETLLLNLFRGSGRTGLAAMQPVSIREVRGARMEIHRPLLGVWRDEVSSYVNKHRLRFHEDKSNADPRFTRNRVRHEVLPFLEKSFDRDLKRVLWRTASVLAAEEEFLASKTPRVAASPLKTADLQALPAALQRRVVHAWLRSHEIADISFEDVESVRSLIPGPKPAKVNLAGKKHARRRAGEIFIE
jgi:tRNA(Ile)-lysidine synthase